MDKSAVFSIIAVICALVGIIMQFVDPFIPDANTNAIGIIGGADGPTSVYVAANVPYNYISLGLIVLGIVIAIMAVFIFVKNKKH